MQGRRQVCKSGDVVKRVYANNWIFSPQTTTYSNIMNLKNWGGLSPPSPSLVYTLAMKLIECMTPTMNKNVKCLYTPAATSRILCYRQ